MYSLLLKSLEYFICVLQMILEKDLIRNFRILKNLSPNLTADIRWTREYSTKEREPLPICPLEFTIVARGTLNNGSYFREDFFEQVVHGELRGDLAPKTLKIMRLLITANKQQYHLQNLLHEEPENGVWRAHLGVAPATEELTIGNYGQITGYSEPNEDMPKLVSGMGTLSIRMKRIFEGTYVTSELLLGTSKNAERKDNELVVGTIENYDAVNKCLDMMRDGSGTGLWSRYLEISLRLEF